ncbi:MAG TPA: MFS transporter [Asanoa sp.]|nr:MFS transporter [Asanoa sp.]
MTDDVAAIDGGPAAPAAGFRGWAVIWAGQFVSMLGSGITGFALAVYVYQTTDSATALGVILALGLLPTTVAAPFAGSLVDRWGPRPTLLAANVGNMLLTVAMAVLLLTDTFAVWHVYVIVVIGSVLGALEVPAVGTLTPRLVPRQHLGRANGMRMTAMAASQVLAPVTGGFLLHAIHLSGIVVLDAVSFGAAILTLLLVRVPHTRPEPAAGAKTSLLAEFREGWHYVAARRGLLALLVFLASVNFSAGFIELLLNPLVLAFAAPAGLGMVLSIGGLGMIIAGVAVSIWGGPRRRIPGLLAFSLVLAVATIAGAARPEVTLVAVAAFVGMGALVVIATIQQGIWQTKVEPRLMGRVMALVSMVGLVPQLVANVLAGVAVDRVFEPWVGRDEVRSPIVAGLVGDGPGRGIALLMMLVGVLVAVTVGGAALSRRLRHLEQDLPDADDAAVPPPQDATPAPARSQ